MSRPRLGNTPEDTGVSRRRLVALSTLLSAELAGCSAPTDDQPAGDAPPVEPETIVLTGEGPLADPGENEWTSGSVGFERG